jgi:two-component sensor histidine kinase
MICSIDTNYNLIEFNTVLANIVKNGFNVDLKPGFHMLDYIDPRRHDHLKGIYDRVLRGEICHDIEAYDTSMIGKIFLETSFHPIFSLNSEITGISIFSKDVTQRIKNEQKVKEALKEKEVLLAEIHHRIKNNLAMISSMLELQELTMGAVDSREALSSSRKRIKTTALIHEMLYRNESFNEISFKEFVRELFDLLKTGNNFSVVLNGEDVTFNLTTALPLGLMLNEIMLNSFKHSYSNVFEGKTEITISSQDELLTIDYCDCQGSFPLDVDFYNSNTTGLTLIHTFAEQLSGRIELVNNEPPVYKILINLNEKN